MTPGAAAALATRPQETPATRSAAASSGAVPDAAHLDESSTKFKMGKCFAALREWRFALAELETIPARARTLPVTLALAEAYKRTGYDRASVACYKECLRINPFAVVAAEALADAGAAPAEPPEDETENAADAFASNALRRLTRGASRSPPGTPRPPRPPTRRSPRPSRGTRASSSRARAPRRRRATSRRRRRLPPAARVRPPRGGGRDEFAELRAPRGRGRGR